MTTTGKYVPVLPAEHEPTCRRGENPASATYCPHGVDLDREFCPKGCRV